MTINAYLEQVKNYELSKEFYETTKLIAECELLELYYNSSLYAESVQEYNEKCENDEDKLRFAFTEAEGDLNPDEIDNKQKNIASKIRDKFNDVADKTNGLLSKAFRAVVKAMDWMMNRVHKVWNQYKEIYLKLKKLDWSPDDAALADLKKLNPAASTDNYFENVDPDMFIEAGSTSEVGKYKDEVKEGFKKVLTNAWGSKAAARRAADEYATMFAIMVDNRDANFPITIRIDSLKDIDKIFDIQKQIMGYLSTPSDTIMAPVANMPTKVHSYNDLKAARNALNECTDVYKKMLDEIKNNPKLSIRIMGKLNKAYGIAVNQQKVMAEDIARIDRKGKYIAELTKAMEKAAKGKKKQ